MKTGLKAAGGLLSVTLLLGCGGGKSITEKVTFENVTAVFEVSTNDIDPSVAKEALQEAIGLFKDRLKVTRGPGNELARLNQQRGPLPIRDEFNDLLHIVVAAMTVTNGAYDPRISGLRELYGFNGLEIREPSEDEIMDELAKIASTKIQLLEGTNAQLTGSVALDLDRIGAAWALDEAADLLQQRGVKSARLSAMDISRFWGQPEPGRKWLFQLKSPLGDTLYYKIEPEEGALSIIQLDQIQRKSGGWTAAPYFSPGSGRMVDYCLGLAAWTDRAVFAAAYAEAMFVWGRRDAFVWLENHPEATVLYFSPNEFGYAAESEKRMSGWFSAYLP
ncbi:MAG: FAD:protein FMN transferase [Calditrichota bacterium]